MENLKSKRHKLAEKMRISPYLLLKLSSKSGKIGRMAAAFDSWQSRTLDRGKGIYAELEKK